jgi:sterol desaturase/sphingolipid hydroxylase (fatty acid hydroxylase superfamily)
MASTGLRVFFGFLGLFVYEWSLRHLAVVHLPERSWLTWIYAFVLYDFCYYWYHRFSHTVGLFWAVHVVHHQSEEFNLTTALRQPSTGVFTTWIFYLPMALTGVPVLVFLTVGVVQLFYQFWPHTRHIGRMGFLDRWIQTPSNHRVHHAQNDIYLDKNYVGVFAVWDRLFGTFQEELASEPCIYGIRGQLRSWNPVWANLHYYWAMAKDCWHAQRWADKLRVWFAPPGWRPADVAARFPKVPYDPRRDFVPYDPPRSLGLSIYVLVQFSTLMVANSHFLAVLPRQPLAANVAYFVFLMLSLVTLGGLMENRPEFLLMDGLRMAATGATVLVFGGWFGGVGDALAVRAIAGFSALSLLALWLASRNSSAVAAAEVS